MVAIKRIFNMSRTVGTRSILLTNEDLSILGLITPEA